MERPNKLVFVFGSNDKGIHGKGAAYDACQYWDADWGVGEGFQGESYAIPTKDKNLKPKSLFEIQKSIFKFLDFANDHLDWMFIMTPIGTGLAGYSIEDISNLFDRDTSKNIVYTSSWFK